MWPNVYAGTAVPSKARGLEAKSAPQLAPRGKHVKRKNTMTMGYEKDGFRYALNGGDEEAKSSGYNCKSIWEYASLPCDQVAEAASRQSYSGWEARRAQAAQAVNGSATREQPATVPPEIVASLGFSPPRPMEQFDHVKKVAVSGRMTPNTGSSSPGISSARSSGSCTDINRSASVHQNLSGHFTCHCNKIHEKKNRVKRKTDDRMREFKVKYAGEAELNQKWRTLTYLQSSPATWCESGRDTPDEDDDEGKWNYDVYDGNSDEKEKTAELDTTHSVTAIKKKDRTSYSDDVTIDGRSSPNEDVDSEQSQTCIGCLKMEHDMARVVHRVADLEKALQAMKNGETGMSNGAQSPLSSAYLGTLEHHAREDYEPNRNLNKINNSHQSKEDRMQATKASELGAMITKAGNLWLTHVTLIRPDSWLAVAILEVFQEYLDHGFPQLTISTIEAEVKEKMQLNKKYIPWRQSAFAHYLKGLVREGQLIMETYGLCSQPQVSMMHRYEELEKEGKVFALSVRIKQENPSAKLLNSVLVHFRMNHLQPTTESIQKALNCYFGVKMMLDDILRAALANGNGAFRYMENPGRTGIFPVSDGEPQVWEYVSMFDFGDLVPEVVWEEFHRFLDGIKAPQNGRYGFAKCCKLLGPSELQKLPFGFLIWMVQKSLLEKVLYLDGKKQIVVRDLYRQPQASALAWKELRNRLMSLLRTRMKLQQVKFLYRNATGCELVPQQYGFKKLKDLLLDVHPDILIEEDNGATMVSFRKRIERESV